VSHLLHGEITERIIGAAYEVYNILGYGFLEKVYENALVIELRGAGLDVKQQHPITVVYKGEIIGEYFADLVVEDKVIVELKSVSALDPAHEVQLVHYLKATGLEVGLLINFGKEIKIIRKILSGKENMIDESSSK
jgi:GxxExxY protein